LAFLKAIELTVEFGLFFGDFPGGKTVMGVREVRENGQPFAAFTVHDG